MHVLIAIDSPATTDMLTTSATMNEPNTTTNDMINTENIPTTPAEDDNDTTPTNERQSPTINAIKGVVCSQNTATGLIAGVAVGGVFIGALITLIGTLIIVAIVRLTKKNNNTLTLSAVNKVTQGISEYDDKMKDVEMKDIEEPVYSVILSNPTVRDEQMDMNMNECYATARTSVAAP